MNGATALVAAAPDAHVRLFGEPMQRVTGQLALVIGEEQQADTSPDNLGGVIAKDRRRSTVPK
jgi:hypothetical protein